MRETEGKDHRDQDIFRGTIWMGIECRDSHRRFYLTSQSEHGTWNIEHRKSRLNRDFRIRESRSIGWKPIKLEFENRIVIDGAEDPLCVLSRQSDLKQMIAR
jgi:hypothetical protein